MKAIGSQGGRCVNPSRVTPLVEIFSSDATPPIREATNHLESWGRSHRVGQLYQIARDSLGSTLDSDDGRVGPGKVQLHELANIRQ